VKLVVVVPTYDEAANIGRLIDALQARFAALPAHEGAILVVDDDSPDGTAAVADDLAGTFPGRVRVMRRQGIRGLGRSYVDGLTQALDDPADVICQMDADLSHDPAQLPSLIAATAHADIVIGSRYVAGGQIVNWPLRRRLLSTFANMYVRTVTRLRAHDCTSGYRCWRRETLASMPLNRFISDGYSFLVEMLYVAARRGSRIAEVPITFVERRLGESKLSRAVLVESAIAPWRLIGRDS